MTENTDHCKACLLGLFVGDAAGATLEFTPGRPSAKKAQRAMRMPGGGMLSVGAGQVTDDSELAIHLLLALHDKDLSDGYPAEAVAREYIKWHRSCPFDMGHTCARAFGFAKSAEDVMANAARYNMFSEANGALMRLAPLVIWARHVPPCALMEIARADAKLSHCNAICQDVNAAYALIVGHLLHQPRDADGALGKLQEVVNELHATVQTWIKESKTTQSFDCTIHPGHVKHAFQLMLHVLRNKMSFDMGIEWVLMQGGDTDTNAAIVGSVLGALHGMDAIPHYMRDPVLSYQPDKVNDLIGQPRPAMYTISHAMDVLDEMLVQSRELHYVLKSCNPPSRAILGSDTTLLLLK